MLPLAALLNGLGIVMIYRLQESGRNGNPGNQITTMSSSATAMQVLYSALGVAAFVAVLVFIREVRVLQRYTYTLGAVGLILLAIPAMLPDSMSEVPGTGAKIQIAVGGFSVQPEQFAELALAVFFAGYLVAKRDVLSLAGRRFLGIDLPRARDLGPVLIAWGVSLLLLVFESDIGTSALFFGLFVVMLYIATQRTSWLLIGILLFVFGAYVASKLFSHVGAAVHGLAAPVGRRQPDRPSPTRLVQGLEGLGFGGIFGTGLGHGQPFWTPLVQSDFIVTAFGEELGLTGLMAMLLIFGLLVQRGLRAAIAVRDPFAKLLAGGLSFAIALQVFIIVGGVTQLIPLTGITTPFLSQGGSSLLATWVLIGAADADQRHRPAPGPAADPGRGHDPGGAGRMNRALFRLSLACLAMFVLLLINVNYVQAFEANSLANRPGNARTFDQQFQYQRGSIIAAGTGGPTTIAESRPAQGSTSGNTTYQRYYPGGAVYAPITGFDSIYGSTAIEQAYEKYLAGTASSLTVHNLISLLTGKPKQGATVYLTVSPKAQQAAYQALLDDGGHQAGVVALNPSTGAILAMASYPTFNPNRLTTLDGAKLDQDRQPAAARPGPAAAQPGHQPDLPARVLVQGHYRLGRVLDRQGGGPDTPRSRPPSRSGCPTATCSTMTATRPASAVTRRSSRRSCCPATPRSANIGMKLGGPALRSYANRFGWNDANLTIPMPVSPSVVPPITDPSFTAMTCDRPVRRPGHAAAGGHGRRGDRQQRHADAAVPAGAGAGAGPVHIGSTQPTVLSQAVSPQVASDLQQMMIQVTQNPAGTAYATAGPPTVGTSLVIAGKTGTAENGVSNAGLDDAVFTCFAPASNPKIAVGVIVKGGGFGADAAAPIAVKIIEAYLGEVCTSGRRTPGHADYDAGR